MRWLGGHLGPQVSALLDGQLDADTSDRAWQHAFGCGQCREAIERETWVKNRLLLMSPLRPPAELAGAISALGESSAESQGRSAVGAADLAWAEVNELERRHRTRRTGLALAGAGSVSLALIGFGFLGGFQVAPGAGPREASINGGSSPAPVPVVRPVGRGVDEVGVMTTKPPVAQP